MIRVLGFTDKRSPVPAARDVLSSEPPPPDARARRIEFDASPWGGGGVLFENDVPVRCFACTWKAKDFTGLDVEIGNPASQTFFEVCAAVLAIDLWCVSTAPTMVVGDNTAALQEVLNLKGSKVHERLAQALAIIRCARTLTLSVAHLPSESNTLADALSRQADPSDPHPWPFADDAAVMRDTPLRPSALWKWL